MPDKITNRSRIYNSAELPAGGFKENMDAFIWVRICACRVAGIAIPAPTPMTKAKETCDHLLHWGTNLVNIKPPKNSGIKTDQSCLFKRGSVILGTSTLS